MYRIKAFGAFPPISNNDPNKVNGLGELSAYAMTYALDRGIFKNTEKPASLLYSFSSLNEISAVESETVSVPPSVSALLLEMMEAMYTKSTAGEFDSAEIPVRDYIMTFWQGQVQNVVVNQMVSDGYRWLPSSIVFEGTSTTAPWQAQIWFSDANFRNEYDLYVNLVVPPIADIDRFFDSATAVQKIVSEEITLIGQMTAVSVVADSRPYTEAITTEFEWHDPTNDARRIPVPWTVVNYGEAGRNIDAIRADLAKWILANTKYTEEQWQKLFPDIFGSTEHIFVPFFNHVAIPDDAVNGGVYSPVGNVKHQIEVATKLIRGAGYTPAYIADNLNIAASVYKSIQWGIIGGYRNRDGINQFGDQWPDYIAVSTSSIDFKRMSDETMDLVIVLNKMMQIAETMTNISAVPRGYMRLIRDDVLYVTATFKRTSLIVASRTSVLEKYQVGQGVTPVPVTP